MKTVYTARRIRIHRRSGTSSSTKLAKLETVLPRDGRGARRGPPREEGHLASR